MIILDNYKIQRIVKRIAFQILEKHHLKSMISFVGFNDNGYSFAHAIKSAIIEVHPSTTVNMYFLNNYILTPENQNTTTYFKDCDTIILFDDVSNSGKTLYKSFHTLQSFEIEHLDVAVLINRTHKRFPIRPNYIGLEIGTTSLEHIQVKLTGEMTTWNATLK